MTQLKPTYLSAVTTLIDLIRSDLRQDFLSALEGKLPPINGTKPRPRPSAWQTKAERKATRAKGEKRKPEDLARLTAELGTYIKKHPGQRIEQIAKGMTCESAELFLPIRKLLANKILTKRGQKRATVYRAR